MKVRFPKWDFSKVRAHWASTPEFSQRYNSASTVPAHIEPYLVKVMMQAKKVLDPKYTKLHEDLDIFIKQEVQHCKQHLAFNKSLYEKGYEGMKAIEEPYRADYDRFLKEKSLRFNLAYAEGFEAMGSASAQVFFEDLDDLLKGADQDAVDLWKWHLAEEFEHREVAFQVYQAICGRGFFSWLYRLYGLFYAVKHIRAHTARLEDYLIEQDRKTMSADEVQRSKERQAEIAKRVAKASLPRLLPALSPFYDPAKKMAPKGMEYYWQQY